MLCRVRLIWVSDFETVFREKTVNMYVFCIIGKDCKLYVKSTRNLRWAILGALKWEKRGEKCNLILQDWEKRDLGASVKIHGLRTPYESFFHWNPRQTNWADKFWGIWGTFAQTIITHFVTVGVRPCLVQYFSVINNYFYKKQSIYINIPNNCLELGFQFEFGFLTP